MIESSLVELSDQQLFAFFCW